MHFRIAGLSYRFRGDALGEGVEGSFSHHAAALVRAFEVVGVKEGIDGGLKLLDVFKPCFSTLDAEAFVKESAMEAFKESIALRTPDLSGFVLDVFELEEKLIRVLVRAATEFAPIVGEDGLDGDVMFLEEGDFDPESWTPKTLRIANVEGAREKGRNGTKTPQ